ncbi:MAG: D-2-hydroxyacid dehydrogenase [Steroidobacteraceae bacterium]
MRGVFLDAATVSRGDLDLSPLHESLSALTLYDTTDATEVVSRLAGQEVVVNNKCRIDRGILAANPQLRLIALTATGFDCVDLQAAREQGVAVANVRDYCTPSVVQHVFGMILSLTHHLARYDALARSGGWASAPSFSEFAFPMRELEGRALGIIGHGALGSAVGRVGEAFGMRVLIANRPGGEPQPGRLDLDALLAEADVLSLHCPLNDATRGLIGRRELSLMKADALLINTARGGLVDAAALAEHLRAGRLGGAGIDVLTQEPPVDGNPLLDPSLPNLVLTPHVAWAAREARQRCIDEVAENIRAHARGERRNRID